MHETLTRRLKHKEWTYPDIIVIDGGKGQLGAVPKLEGITYISLAKRFELVFTTTQDEPVVLSHHSYALRLLQRIRDEAHRFAIGTHRLKRSHDSFKTTLDEIEGIGSKRRKMLIEHFGSPRAVFDASLSDLLQVKNLPEKIAKNIYTFLHK